MAELHSQMMFETDLAIFVATKLVPFVVNQFLCKIRVCVYAAT